MVQEKTQSIVEVQREIQDIEGRDFQLWSIGAVVFLVTAAGFSSMILPNMAGNLENLEIQGRYLPQLILGFITLIIFFSVNDRFGHLEGDRFLNQIAMLLKRTFRNSDTVFRYGGDEFLVLMPDTHGERAPLVVDRLEEEVARWNQENSACGYEMSLSCGFASYSTGDDLREVLQIADKQMYQNKYAEKIAS